MAINPLRSKTGWLHLEMSSLVVVIRRSLVFALMTVALVGPAWGEISVTNHPFAGIAIYSETRPQPPTRLFVAEIDLTNPKVRLRVSPGGPDPDGLGPWQTTLLPPTRIAAREHLNLVINGDFFRARGVKDAEGVNSTFRAETWSAVNGPAVTDGKVWATSTTPRPCLVVHTNREVTIERLEQPQPGDWEVVAGNTTLVEAGVPVPHTNQARHPRTAVGLNAKRNKLVILVVDGRKPGIAIGMSYDELAAEMIRLGCREAINLDGGGSSVMAIRDPRTTEFHILNEPTDGRERAVANVLGVIVENSSGVPSPAK